MSGSPTWAELHGVLTNIVGVLENQRNVSDGTMLGKLDTLEQSAEGDYLPAAIGVWSADFRAGLSSLASPGRARQILNQWLFEVGKLINSPYRTPEGIFRDLYDYMHANSYYVQSRTITFASASADGSNVGNGTIVRLTKDERNYDLEAVTIEAKKIIVRADRNTGAFVHGELLELHGIEESLDSLNQSAAGSGMRGRGFLRAKHAGNGAGGSILRNSAFTTYSATATPKFDGWTEASGGSNLSSHTTAGDQYRTYPNVTTMQCLKASGNFKITQLLEDMRQTRLDPDTPLYVRIMVNKTVGTASGGNIILRWGSNTVTQSIAGLGAGWQEVKIPVGQYSWYRNIKQNDLDLEIEWESYSSGYLLVADALVVPFDFVDGSYWVALGGSTPWSLHDFYTLTDTGGAPATAKVQWWIVQARLGYLPHNATETITEPS